MPSPLTPEGSQGRGALHCGVQGPRGCGLLRGDVPWAEGSTRPNSHTCPCDHRLAVCPPPAPHPPGKGLPLGAPLSLGHSSHEALCHALPQPRVCVSAC